MLSPGLRAAFSPVQADSSKYGTHIRTASGAAELKLTNGQQMQLQDGSILRFGTKCKYKLTIIPFKVCCPSSCTPKQLAAAAACHAAITDHYEPGGGCTHYMAVNGENLTAQLLVASADPHTPDNARLAASCGCKARLGQGFAGT